ncbi:hypothetical protein [Romeriopsis navalis]|uniref:hypothetical protein n=1 Tax=Romeriopsis navalis TaxID=2992132 RepID=UPI0021F86A98|nr:hypothetical protein [Romeriopsis navalis]
MKNSKQVSWGRAAVGWALLGPIGGAVGAVTGADDSANACLECGETWKAQDIHHLIGNIHSLTGVRLNLEKDTHRRCLNDYITELLPTYAAMDEAKKYNPETEHKGRESDARIALALSTGLGIPLMLLIFSTRTDTDIPGLIYWIVGLVPAVASLVLLPKSQAEKELPGKMRKLKLEKTDAANRLHQDALRKFKSQWYAAPKRGEKK